MKPISALTEDIDDLTEANVTSANRADIEAAKAAVEREMENTDATEAEKNAVNEGIKRMDAALKAIEQLERAEQMRKAARTGDNAMPVLWLEVAVAAIAAVVVIAVMRKKQ